ncbi:hypothetical protein glysoja_026044 [Glycine soja]|uniref:TMV resistance protein N n=1 Tax=Glycine soja TaxID=3848 RepID=A0A0B2QGS9_GLYSO|nr:hypothetical protein glysoja_026044 [Glycine soja]
MADHENRFAKQPEKVKNWRKALSQLRHLTREYCKDDGICDYNKDI